MNILFTADIHIKLGQKNVPVDWAKNRYSILFSKYRELQQQADLFVLGGDTFDKMPSIEELEVFFKLINSCTIPTIIYSGNHEAVKKNTTFLSNLKDIVHTVNSNVIIIDDYYSYGNIDFIPYNKLKEYVEAPVTFTGDIVCTHVRGEIPPHVKPEINLEVFDKWKVALAGDLHSYDNCQRNILYPGSPLTTSFHRNTVNTGVILINSSTLDHEWIEIDVPQLIRKNINAGDDMPATDYHHTIYEIEGDMAELSSIQDNGLIDKKVVKRETDTALILSPEMTLEEEVDEYLRYIMELNDDSIKEVLLELSNNASKFT